MIMVGHCVLGEDLRCTCCMCTVCRTWRCAVNLCVRWHIRNRLPRRRCRTKVFGGVSALAIGRMSRFEICTSYYYLQWCGMWNCTTDSRARSLVMKKTTRSVNKKFSRLESGDKASQPDLKPAQNISKLQLWDIYISLVVTWGERWLVAGIVRLYGGIMFLIKSWANPIDVLLSHQVLYTRKQVRLSSHTIQQPLHTGSALKAATKPHLCLWWEAPTHDTAHNMILILVTETRST